MEELVERVYKQIVSLQVAASHSDDRYTHGYQDALSLVREIFEEEAWQDGVDLEES